MEYRTECQDVLWTDYEEGIGEWKASRKEWEGGVGERRVRVTYEHGV